MREGLFSSARRLVLAQFARHEIMQLLIGSLERFPRATNDVEIVERKGLGHPDTICDALAEELSVALCRYYLDHFDLVLHHNVDKVLLWGGVSRPAFGGGEILEPMELFLAGRASSSFGGIEVPVAEIAESVCHDWFRKNLHALDSAAHVEIHPLIRSGSSELVDLFMQQKKTGVWLANDTSFGVGFAPTSTLEQLTMEIENKLNSDAVKTANPQIGQDVKVMSVRRDGHIDITVACALIGKYLDGLDSYLESKELVASMAVDVASRLTTDDVTVGVNTADDPISERIYITVTGTSAECGDDGEAGRGNRANGLITPFRPMALESVAGKNPVTHVGKLYNVAAREIAAALVAELPDVVGAECALVSQIGRPVDDPQTVAVRVCTGDRSPEEIAPQVRECVDAQVAAITTLWERIIRQEVPLY